jgi:hypothetical protein
MGGNDFHQKRDILNRARSRIVAQGGIVQRGLQNLSQTVRAVRTGEGEGKAARFGKSARRGLAKAKSGFSALTSRFGGMSEVDAYEEDIADQDRRRKARQLLGDQDGELFTLPRSENRDLSATVAPEFRAQVTAGLATANSMTTGSTVSVLSNDGFESNASKDQ